MFFVPLYPLEPAKPLNDAQMCGSFYFYIVCNYSNFLCYILLKISLESDIC